MQAMLPEAPGEFRKVIADFVQESQDELFPTREECVAWAREHFDGLVSGALGGNLLSKYSMLGRFYATQASLDFLHEVIAAVAGDSEPLDAIMDYLRCVLLHAPFARSLAVSPEWTTRYDIEAWARHQYDKPLAAYQYAEPRVFFTDVEAERKALLENRLLTFGEHPSGLGKFTRTMFARDLRRTVHEVATHGAGRADSGGHPQTVDARHQRGRWN
jgi:hypothetical protein